MDTAVPHFQPGVPPIVGRERELAQLGDVLGRTLAGTGSLALLSGEAGIGKTTLVRALIRAAADQGCLVLTGSCYDMTTTPPYGPWTEVLRGYAPSTNQPPLPAWINNPAELEQIRSQQALFEDARRFFVMLAEHQPLVIVLEDLHWADPGTVDALRFLARSSTNVPILILATYRDDEPRSDHPLLEVIPALIREAHAERIELRRWPAPDTSELIAGRYRLSEPHQEQLAAYVQRLTEGNPFYAVELLRSLEGDGLLRPRAGGWDIAELTSPQVPPLIRQILERRLAHLSPTTLDLLEMAAVIGQQAPFELWQRVSGAGDEPLLSAVQEALALQLVDEQPDRSGIQFRHALVRETIYARIPGLRLRTRHRHVAEALIRRSVADPDEVAHHFQQAGDVRAVAWLLESARRARMTFATATAVERLETALALDEQDAGASGLRGWLLAGLAGWGELFAHIHECMRMLDEAMEIALRTNDDALVALIEWYRAFIETNFSAPVVEKLGKVRDRIQDLPPGDRDRLVGFIYGAVGTALDPSGPEMTCMIIGWQGESGQYRETLAAIEQIRAAHPRLSAAAELSIDMALMACSQALGRPDDALQFYERVLAALRRDRVSDWAAIVARLKLRDLILVYWPDRIDMRRAAADEAVTEVRLAKADQTFSQDMPDEVGITWLLLLDGRWDDARRAVEQSSDHSASHPTIAPWMTLARHQGEPEAGLARLSLVFPDGPRSEPGRTTFETSVLCMHAAIEIALDGGDLESASAWLACHDRWMAWSGSVPLSTLGSLLWAHYHHVAGDHTLAEERARRALALATEPRQPLALLAAHRLLGELETERGAFDSAQQNLAEALALSDACQAPFERALTLVSQAELAVARGDREAARPLLAEVRAICEPLGAKPMLERITTLEARLFVAPKPRYPAGLSAREVEVLALLVEGLSNREIADRLSVSHRTVMNHVSNILGKLGVTSRTAAATVALREGLIPPR